MAVRAKFQVNSYTTRMATVYEGGTSRTVETRTVHLSPVVSGSEENKRFYAMTPSGQIELSTINEEAWSQFELGKTYYIDFIRAD